MLKISLFILINLLFLITCLSTSPLNEEWNVQGHVERIKRSSGGPLQVKWFNQQLNHFNRTPNATTWKQVYLNNIYNQP